MTIDKGGKHSPLKFGGYSSRDMLREGVQDLSASNNIVGWIPLSEEEKHEINRIISLCGPEQLIRMSRLINFRQIIAEGRVDSVINEWEEQVNE